MDEALVEMEAVWDGGESLLGMVYSKEEANDDLSDSSRVDWEMIASFCRCLGGTKLAAILKRLVKNPAYRSGLPDCAGTVI